MLRGTVSALRHRLRVSIRRDAFRFLSGTSNVSPSERRAQLALQFERRSPREHVLLRPETYIGSTALESRELWVAKLIRTKLVMEKKEVLFSPGLYKIFDEILVNASDNATKLAEAEPWRRMSYIKVIVDLKNGFLSVENDGDGLPVMIHPTENVYVPDLVFGTLLTSSNYDDSVQRYTGGRNGYGAKLTNIFSEEFVVEIMDRDAKKFYRQVFLQNMSKKGTPMVRDLSNDEILERKSYTRISFTPDLSRFGMTELDQNIESVFLKRCVDLSACNSGIEVYFNDRRIPVSSFADLVQSLSNTAVTDSKLPNTEQKRTKKHIATCSPLRDWELAVRLSDGQFEQHSYVNGIATLRGGTHVELVSTLLCKHILKAVQSKVKGLKLTASQIRPFICIFLNTRIPNPTFDSQTKEFLTSSTSEIANLLEFDEQFLKKLLNQTGIVSTICEFFEASKKKRFLRAPAASKRSKSGMLGIPKLEDANLAGSDRSDECTLIITEGDSAKALAVAGLSIIGRDKFGVFPLRGKMLNVREAPLNILAKNEEMICLRNIIGLDPKLTYKSEKERSTLRYGRVMLMTDQDYDGSHIKGLFINMLHSFWPELLKSNRFLDIFITPLLKAKKRGSKNTEVSFFSFEEYDNWKKEKTPAELKSWTIKYYKGLGTSTAAEAKEYFSNLSTHRIRFHWENQELYSNPDYQDNLIEMAFAKNKSDERKIWIESYTPSIFSEIKQTASPVINVDAFINQELILFSIYSTARAIPSIMDGLKPGQRKVLFGSFKRNLINQEIKVVQLAGYVSEHAMYHHGEASLHSTIVSMAQDFVGANNISLLEPIGQFGTRHLGGKDAASPRYIHTKLSPITRLIFHSLDDPILKYLDEDGVSVEPEWYVPVIPMLLVNGCQGIGTGFSTSIPPYNPLDLIRYIKEWIHLRGNESVAKASLTPWFRGFNGKVLYSENKSSKVETKGVFSRLSDTQIEISELPIGRWTSAVKVVLDDEVKNDGSMIMHYQEEHTDRNVKFIVTCKSKTDCDSLLDGGLERILRLSSKLSMVSLS